MCQKRLPEALAAWLAAPPGLQPLLLTRCRLRMRRRGCSGQRAAAHYYSFALIRPARCAEFRLLDEQLAAMAAAVEASEALFIDDNELARLATDIPDLRVRLGIGDTQVFGGQGFSLVKVQLQASGGVCLAPDRCQVVHLPLAAGCCPAPGRRVPGPAGSLAAACQGLCVPQALESFPVHACRGPACYGAACWARLLRHAGWLGVDPSRHEGATCTPPHTCLPTHIPNFPPRRSARAWSKSWMACCLACAASSCSFPTSALPANSSGGLCVVRNQLLISRLRPPSPKPPGVGLPLARPYLPPALPAHSLLPRRRRAARSMSGVAVLGSAALQLRIDTSQLASPGQPCPAACPPAPLYAECNPMGAPRAR